MELLGVFGLGIALGLVLRRAGVGFAGLYRGQLAVISLPLAVAAGWRFSWAGRPLEVMGIVLAAELLSLGTAMVLTVRGRLTPMTAWSSGANTTFWAVPVGAALGGTPAAVFLTVYDTVVALRGIVQTRFLRAIAPVPQRRVTALADFAKPIGLGLGLIAAFTLPDPSWLGGLVVALGELAGVVGIATTVLALPSRWPARADYRPVLPLLGFRYVPVTVAMGAMLAAGVGPPPVTWVLAFCPAPFNTIATARLYGLSRQIATAAVLSTLAVSAALLPLVAVLAG